MAASNSKRRPTTSAKARTTKPAARPSARPRVARPGDNTLEGRATPFLKRIEGKLDDLESLRGSYMSQCKGKREDIREIISEAKDAGIPVKAMKSLVEYRVLEKKQAKIADGLDIDEAAAYSQLVNALGPLGLAAAKAAGYLPEAPAPEPSEDERDVRPRHMTQPDAAAPISGSQNGSEPRADEAELARLGRGHDDDPTTTSPEQPAHSQ